jgi:lambda family phage portal protein
MRKPRAGLIDRAIAALDPVKGLARQRARTAMALMESTTGSEGASRTRRGLINLGGYGGGPEADLHSQLATLRARARHLYRNAPIARGAIDEKVSLAVGCGHICAPQIDRDLLGLSHDEAEEWEGRASRLWRMHAESPNIHAGGTLNFAEIEALALRSALMSGDVLTIARFKDRADAPFASCIQLVEGDRLANPSDGADSKSQSGGVRRDSDGEPTEYHILDTHPGEFTHGETGRGKWYRAKDADGRRIINHLFFARRPGQTRGEPFLAPVIEALMQLKRYTEAEIFAAVVNSCFAVVTKSESGDGVDLIEQSIASGSGADERKAINIVEPGQIVDLLPDEEISSFSPERPTSSFDPFMRALLAQIAMALETTEEMLGRSFKASYSASRGSIEIALRFAATYDKWIVSRLCQPTYEMVIEEAVARGYLSAPGFFEDRLRRAAWLGALWIGPPRMTLDPSKEASADEMDLAMGVTDKIHIAAKRGRHFDDVVAARDRTERLEEKFALASAPPAPSQPPAADQEEEDEREEHGDEEDGDDERPDDARRALDAPPLQVHVHNHGAGEAKAPEVVLKRGREVVTVTAHDEHGRIKTFEKRWEDTP